MTRTPSQFEQIYTAIYEMPQAFDTESDTVGLTTNASPSKRTERLTKAEREEQRHIQKILNDRKRQMAFEYESDYYAAIGIAA